MHACVRELAANDVGSSQHLNAVITKHDRVEEIEIAFARLVDHAASEAAVERKNHSVADRYRGLRLLENDGQCPAACASSPGKCMGKDPTTFIPCCSFQRFALSRGHSAAC